MECQELRREQEKKEEERLKKLSEDHEKGTELMKKEVESVVNAWEERSRSIEEERDRVSPMEPGIVVDN